MKLVIEIETDNDAFRGKRYGDEVQRILNYAVYRACKEMGSRPRPGYELTLQDINGNTVGKLRIAE